MVGTRKSIKRFIEIHLPVGVCNLKCSYCYVDNSKNKTHELRYTPKQIGEAFSAKRLGGCCLISICSDGETLLHPQIVPIVTELLNEGHLVMIVTNGLVTTKIMELLNFPILEQSRIMFKISIHYEEMVRRKALDCFFANIKQIKKSPCSFSLEYTTDDDGLKLAEVIKDKCREELNGTLPHINIPRDERKINLGVYSKYSLSNYYSLWEAQGFNSNFFEYRKQFFGHKYKDFCYAGYRFLWINLEDGKSRQCYGTKPIQDFMNPSNKVYWIPIGHNCPFAHCYVCHTFFTLGIANVPQDGRYNANYYEIRNRCGTDGIEWVKEPFKFAFGEGIEKKEFSIIEKWLFDAYNDILRWKNRKSQ